MASQAPPGTVLTTWACVDVGDVICPAPGVEYEVIEFGWANRGQSASHVRVKIQRYGEASTNEVPGAQPVYIRDRVTAAATRDGVSATEVAAGVLTSGGLAPETVTPEGETGAAILRQCPECFALIYPSGQPGHTAWHEITEARLGDPI